MGIVLFPLFLNCKSNVAGVDFALAQIQTTLLDYLLKTKGNKTVPM